MADKGNELLKQLNNLSKNMDKDFIWNISNHQVQDILEDIGLLDNEGKCTFTVEEIFREGAEFIFKAVLKWLRENVDPEHDYPNSTEELANDLVNHFGCEV